MSSERVMGSVVFADGSRWTCRDDRLRVIITWPRGNPEADAGPCEVRDAETGECLPVEELRVTWSGGVRLIMAEASLEGGERPVGLAVTAMRIAPAPEELQHACPECGLRRDYRLEPADGGKFGRKGIPLRRRWSCVAGHVQVEDE